MPLHVKAADVPVRRITLKAGAEGNGTMEVRKAFGRQASLMIAERAPGYHTKPHQHPAEQINYVLRGEIWFFVEDQAFHCRAGDFQRIPANSVHWAWNKSDQPALVAEVHAPPLIAGEAAEGSVSLLAAGEEPPAAAADNEFVPYDAAAVEARTADQGT
ncbi:MAG: cupin domain-containing protein [Chloroflexi bacterium]|nr:cupin domain-containing protein [Chloroflexota bacterium]